MEAMTVGQLKAALSRCDERDEHLEVKVLLALPSIGGHAFTVVTDAYFGFDWDNGLLLRTKDRIVPKKPKQDVFEKAYDLLMYLATEGLTKKRKSYENRTAERIMLKNGTTPEKLKKYVRFFHPDKEIVNELEIEKESKS